LVLPILLAAWVFREFSRSVRDESTTGAGERIAAFAQERKFGPGGGEPNRRATDMLQCLQNLAWQLRPDPGQGVVRVAGRIA
jgi:hypothetical protein